MNAQVEVGKEVTRAYRKEVDQAIYQNLDVSYEDRPATWKRQKQELVRGEQERQDLIRKLRNAILLSTW